MVLLFKYKSKPQKYFIIILFALEYSKANNNICNKEDFTIKNVVFVKG